MAQSVDAGQFDAYYFAHCCGSPYGRTTEWLNFFSIISDAIVRLINPHLVLDAGCAMGLLVETLRERNVQAFGIDASAYAIQNVREDIKPYCQVASVTDPFSQHYDLVVCIEVLEHLTHLQAEQAVANICRYTDDVLFSSTPNDYAEVSHINVQPPEYWAELFAHHGFFRDVDFDASFITPWAVRFRKIDQLPRAIRNYERRLAQLKEENTTLRGLASDMQKRLADLETTQTPKSANVSVRTRGGSMQNSNVLLISQDTIGTRMAGPAIRYYHLAQALAQEFNVTLASPDETEIDLVPNGFKTIQYRRADWESIKDAVEAAQVIILPSDIASDLPQLASCRAALVIDGYDPMLAEWLQMAHGLPADEKQARWLPRMCELSQQYLIGDFFICASERQRDWWLGVLAGYGRVNPWTFSDDSSFRKLIDVVPYGLPEKPAQHTRSIIRTIWKNIRESDRVILWGGGLWPWLDPLTAVQAIALVRQVRKDVCLIFPGTKHPNPWMAGMPNQTDATRQLACELGLLDLAVFFHDWIPYDDWQNVLLESDLALTLHGTETLETRFAFRSRVLDYIWAGLPVIATRGDATSDLIAENELGIVVANHDVDGVAQAILKLLSAPPSDFVRRFERVRASLTWERAVQPLVDFCRSPRRAPDKQILGDQLGNPFYTGKIAELETKVQAFERRRVVRLLNTMVGTKTKLLGQ